MTYLNNDGLRSFPAILKKDFAQCWLAFGNAVYSSTLSHTLFSYDCIHVNVQFLQHIHKHEDTHYPSQGGWVALFHRLTHRSCFRWDRLSFRRVKPVPLCDPFFLDPCGPVYLQCDRLSMKCFYGPKTSVWKVEVAVVPTFALFSSYIFIFIFFMLMWLNNL